MARGPLAITEKEKWDFLFIVVYSIKSIYISVYGKIGLNVILCYREKYLMYPEFSSGSTSWDDVNFRYPYLDKENI